jgi:hypothetical protein
MSEFRKMFEEALQADSPVKRMEAMSDLSFVAHMMVERGEGEEAIELLELLVSLDRDDDLMRPFVDIADEDLLRLGVRTLPPLAEVVATLQQEHQALPERDRLLAVAHSLVRIEGTRRPECWMVAAELAESAQLIQPLNQKESRFRLEAKARAAKLADPGGNPDIA